MAESYLTPQELESEEWRTIPKWEGHYQASSLGRIRSIKTTGTTWYGRILKPKLTKFGYQTVNLKRPGLSKHPFVHCLIAAAFIGPKPHRFEVNHKDAIKTNNRANNLEYKTSKGNKEHAKSLGLMPTGDRHGTRKHPETRERGEQHWTHRTPEKLSKGQAHYYRQHPDKIPQGEDAPSAKLTNENVRQIRELLAQGIGGSEIARRFHVNKTTVSRIKLDKIWRAVR